MKNIEANIAECDLYYSEGRKLHDKRQATDETSRDIEMDLISGADIKCLKDMTLAELWQLFPITLIPHQPQWKVWAKEEVENLYKILLLQHSPTINHIGSTAVPNIMSKPIVDILVEIVPGNDCQRAKTIMEKAGYICMASSYNRMSFNKGYTLKGYAEKVFHIHFHVFGDNDEIYFRDYLIANPIIACKYETLKLRLLSRYRNDRDKYTHAKSGFIKQITNLAKINNSRSDTSEAMK